MNSTELIAFAREQATVANESTEWDSTKFLELLNQARVEIFEPIIAACTAGYWTRTLIRTLGAGNDKVRLPPRCSAFLHVDIRRNTDPWVVLQEALESEQQAWERESQDCPVAYIIRGTTMHLIPAPVDGSYTIRVKFVIRPSVLVTPQAAGLITDIDTNTRIITVNSMPVDRVSGVTLAGTLNVDVVEPIDNYELSLFNAQATVLTGTTIQIANGYALNGIQQGDYLRAANQSDWPQLPEPFHTSLGSAAAILPCVQRDMYERVAELKNEVASSANRLAAHIKPRSRTQTQERRPVQHSWE